MGARVPGRDWIRCLVVMCVTGCVWHAWPGEGHACLYAPHLTPQYPSELASNVPLDAVPWFSSLGFTAADFHVRILGPEDVEVGVEVTEIRGSLYTHIEVWPTALLSPDTAYQLLVDPASEAHDPEGLSLRVDFRTGEGIAPAPPPPPAASMELLEFEAWTDSSCGGGHVACIGAAEASTLELRVLDPDTGDVMLWELGGDTMRPRAADVQRLLRRVGPPGAQRVAAGVPPIARPDDAPADPQGLSLTQPRRRPYGSTGRGVIWHCDMIISAVRARPRDTTPRPKSLVAVQLFSCASMRLAPSSLMSVLIGIFTGTPLGPPM
jgi:hypothetical protein